MIRTRFALSCVVAILAVNAAACSSDSSKPEATDSSEATTASGDGSDSSGSDTAQGGLCEGYSVGEEGVVRLFCDGPATAEVTIDGKARSLEGGSCEDAAEGFSANFGVVSESDTPSQESDYFGLVIMPAQEGASEQATIAYRLDGNSDGALADAPKVAADKSTISVSTQTMGGKAVTASIQCNN